MDNRLKIEIDGNSPKSVLCAADGGEETGVRIEGSTLEILRMYVILSCDIHEQFLNSGLDENEASRLVKSGIKAYCELEGKNMPGFFDKSIISVREGGCLIGTTEDSEICAALTASIEKVYEILKSKYGERFAKYLLFNAWRIGVGEIEMGEEMNNGEEEI